jgi:sialidase-1
MNIKILLLLIIMVNFQAYADPFFQKNKLFEGGRFPGLGITNKGTVLAFWGDKQLLVRRSIDKGKTFGRDIVIAKKGINGGGVIVENDGGRILAFSQSKHPPAESFIHESNDDGLTWKTSKLEILNEEREGQIQLHFSGSGIDLRSMKCQGRIIRPTRVYGTKDGYNNAIYSDNGSQWIASKEFPIKATGEGAIVELEDGALLYSSRKHWFSNQKTASPFRLFAYSSDCGETWQTPFESKGLFDGPRYRGLSKGKGPTHQGHFGLMGDLSKLHLDGREVLLHSNVYEIESDWKRRGLTIWASIDGGISWPIKRKIHVGPSAYSSLQAVQNEKDNMNSLIMVHFEGGEEKEYEGSYLSIFNLWWLLGEGI